MTFIRGKEFPDKYHNAAVAAFHGSWNKTEKDGYKVVSLHWDNNGKITAEDFLSGLLQGDDAIGRPADVAEGPDGAIYISDDYANVVYRVANAEDQQQMLMAEAKRSFDAEKTLATVDKEDRSRMSEQGSALFSQFQCASCHANVGDGMKALESIGQKYDLDTLAKYIERPNPPMPIFPLDEEQRQSLAVYLIESYSGSSD
ncbi:MAG: mono/diheme cytochrome c family protein [Oceanicoccus sp.]|jgi:mono/diheme cytochrome c family protein